jgi:hypothetical membrane protein
VSRRTVRALASGGVVGPVVFVITWLAAGLATKGYSPVGDAISDLARLHAPTQVAMTFGFIGFGAGVIGFGFALRAAGAGAAWISAVATACFTLAVAATPLGGPTRDVVHGTFASLGYVTLAGAPFLAARRLALRGRTGWARFSLVTAGLVAACLAASALGPAHGLAQRAGLTTGDVWIVVIALQLMSGNDLFGPRPIPPGAKPT